jgi:hypothetical protein
MYIDRASLPPDRNHADWPEYFDETLVAVDYEARTLLYRVDGRGANCSRNYQACNEIDDLGGGRSRLAFRARFDLPPGGSVIGQIARMESIFGLMAQGFEEKAPVFIKDRRPALMKVQKPKP